MLFCPKCGSLLKPREEGKKTMLTCGCGHSSTEKEDILLQENIKREKKIEVVEETEMETFPKIKAECPKCAGKEAYFWTVQTRAGDEAETKFYQCTKCRHRWREYN